MRENGQINGGKHRPLCVSRATAIPHKKISLQLISVLYLEKLPRCNVEVKEDIPAEKRLDKTGYVQGTYK
jgi:hypothetical protein